MTTVGDLQRWMDSLAAHKPSSRARLLSAIESLFSFAQRIGFLTFNFAAVRDQLAQRIVDPAYSGPACGIERHDQLARHRRR